MRKTVKPRTAICIFEFSESLVAKISSFQDCFHGSLKKDQDLNIPVFFMNSS